MKCPANYTPQEDKISNLPYLPVYESVPCISLALILEPKNKNKFFLFLG